MKESNPAAKVPAEVERVVMRCLEKDPAKRPQSARELADEFLRAAGHVARPTATLSTSSRSVPQRMSALDSRQRPLFSWLSAWFGRWCRRDGVRRRRPSIRSRASRRPKAGRTWIPDGYEPVSDERASASPDEVVKLKRLADGVVFVRSERPGVYIPDGYTPEFSDSTSRCRDATRTDSRRRQVRSDHRGVYLPAGYEEVKGDRIASWPSAITRSKDGVKFIRITGGTYQRGDPGEDPALDSEGQPCTPHYVRVPDFYIQETEVTNAEIEAYIKANPDGRKT